MLNVLIETTPCNGRVGRRGFVRVLGGTLGAGVLLTGCGPTELPGPTPATDVALGAGDIGILNYAYALEQLETAFYTTVLAAPYAGMTTAERELLTEIRAHEQIHRDFFRAALGSDALRSLEFDFSGIDFTNRQALLTAARQFEDTGVAAYNGAGKLIKDVNYLLLAGKIVSVEARHAAVIRDLLNPKTAAFAGDDVVNPQGLDLAVAPSVVLAQVQPFVRNRIDAGQLPT